MRLALAAAALAGAAPARAGAFRNSAHGDQSVLPLACGSCHVGHGFPRTQMMAAIESRMCFQCHGDAAGRSVARTKGLLVGGEELANVAADFAKTSRHPLDLTGQAPRRAPLRRSTQAAGSLSSVSCSDCHDSHYMADPQGTVSTAATQVKQIGNARHGPSPEHDLCYRCHGAAAGGGAGEVDVERLLRPANPSYHPVETTGRNPDVPSLIRPYTVQSVIACTSCHGSDAARGPGGPHGSTHAPILKAHYAAESDRPETPYQYALCYRCHSRTVLLNEAASGFRGHKEHIVEARASCRACHNSHGSSRYSHLIDFDTRIVFASRANGQLRFTDLGSRRGSCSLLCHDKDHDNETYPDD